MTVAVFKASAFDDFFVMERVANIGLGPGANAGELPWQRRTQIHRILAKGFVPGGRASAQSGTCQYLGRIKLLVHQRNNRAMIECQCQNVLGGGGGPVLIAEVVPHSGTESGHEIIVFRRSLGERGGLVADRDPGISRQPCPVIINRPRHT